MDPRQQCAKMSSLAGRVLLTVALIAPCACVGVTDREAADGDAPTFGGIAVIASPTDLDHANALVSADRYTRELLRHALFLPLLAFDSVLDYGSALARSWSMEGDTTLLMHLRRDVHWHDGRLTTAQDVAFTLDRARDTRTPFVGRDYFRHWTGVEVIDSFTVLFRFEPHAEPMAGLPFLPIMPRHLLDSIPPDRLVHARFNHRPVGNGPFRFVEYVASNRWVFEANPDFPAELGGRPWLDRLVWRVLPDGNAQATEVRVGGADLILSPPTNAFDALAAEPGIRGIERPSRQYGFIGWNGKRAPLDDLRVRRALTMAIDRQQIIDALRGGHGTVAAGPIFPGHWAYRRDLEPLPYAPDSARSLLAEAGIRDTDGDGVLDLPGGGGAFELELQHAAGSGFSREVAELIQAQLAAAGVRLNVRATEFQTMVAGMTNPERRFDAVLMGWESDVQLRLRDLFHSSAIDGPYQLASYANAEVDRVLDETARMVDRAPAIPLLHRFQELMRDEQPWSFLYYFPDLYIASERLRGVEMDSRGALVNVTRWWIPAQQQHRAEGSRSDSADRSPSRGSEPGR